MFQNSNFTFEKLKNAPRPAAPPLTFRPIARSAPALAMARRSADAASFADRPSNIGNNRAAQKAAGAPSRAQTAEPSQRLPAAAGALACVHHTSTLIK